MTVLGLHGSTKASMDDDPPREATICPSPYEYQWDITFLGCTNSHFNSSPLRSISSGPQKEPGRLKDCWCYQIHHLTANAWPPALKARKGTQKPLHPTWLIEVPPQALSTCNAPFICQTWQLDLNLSLSKRTVSTSMSFSLIFFLGGTGNCMGLNNLLLVCYVIQNSSINYNVRSGLGAHTTLCNHSLF